MRGSKHHPGVKPIEGVPESDVREFRERLQGRVFTHEDDGYRDARRVWNGLINRYPAVVAGCDGVADVIDAVAFAREHDLPASVRGGGHNVAGTAVNDGGLVIDLSGMNGVDVDPDARRARVEPGVTLGKLNRETQVFGLAAPGGMAADTGVAGSTLGGGLGWLRRKYGLGVDNVRSFDVVLADGEFVTASASSHEDLYWALRGGGGSFGVVTSFEFDLHPVGPEVATAMAYYSGDDSERVLRSYREFAADAPDEVTTLAFHSFAPDGDDVPEAERGAPALGIMGCYAGPVEEGTAALRPLREFEETLVDYSGVSSFVDFHDTESVYPHGRNYYWKSTFLDGLGDECIERFVAHAKRAPSHHSSLTLWQLGGEMNRVDAAETAFAERDAPFMLTAEASWDDPHATSENVEWARDAREAMREFSGGGMYVNFPGLAEDGSDLLRNAYGENYERLREVKREYDPTNRFRFGENATLTE